MDSNLKTNNRVIYKVNFIIPQQNYREASYLPRQKKKKFRECQTSLVKHNTSYN